MRIKLWGMALLLAGLCSGLWTAQAVALSTDGYEIPYVGVSGLYQIPDNERDQRNGYGFRALVGLPLNENSSLELSYFNLQNKRNIDGQDDYQSGLWIDYLYDFGLFGFEQKYIPDFKPYVLAGPGVERDDSRGSPHYNGGIDAGAGLLFPIKIGTWNWGWSLRTEGRVVAEYNTGDFPNKRFPVDYHLEVGLNIPLTVFFKHPDRAAPRLDCATAVVDPVTGRADCVGDSDGDGVTDDKDQCPGTPAGTKVDEKGCPIEAGNDEDGDGVLDSDDQCPHTPHGVKVDAKGCAIEQTVVLDGVNFELNSAVLTGAGTRVLDFVGQALNDQKNISVEIGGHTDNSGSKAYNLKLSAERAESVRQYLIDKGVEADRMTTKGYGESEPVASNKTEEGRASNRRVEFKIILK